MSEKKVWHRAIAELLAVHETFRRLGFPSEHLFVNVYSGGQVQFLLDHKGQKFSIDIDRVEDRDAFHKEWLEACEWWNSDASKGQMSEIYHFSHVAGMHPKLLAALAGRDIKP